MSLHFRSRSISYNLPLDSMFGACCTDNSCDETTAASCYENINGRFFHNLTCDDVNCEFGVCCNNGTCSMTTEVGCDAINGEFIGKEFDCLTYNCTGTGGSQLDQACCFSNNNCEDLDPAICLQRGGVPRGPNSNCATINAAGGCGVTGVTAHGVCCIGGQCLGPQGYDPNGNYHEFGYTAGDCASLGGLFGGSGSTCGAGTSFGTSFPCVFPTGSCCFGNSPAGGITYCENGKTYGDCLNPPTLGGSGGANWFVGKTCGQLQEESICISGSSGRDAACCFPEYRSASHDLFDPPVQSPILANYNCINTSETACAAAGGTINPNGNLCEEISCCEQDYQPQCDTNTLGTLVEFIGSADGSSVSCSDTTLTGSLDIRDAFIQNNSICPTCPITTYVTHFYDQTPTGLCTGEEDDSYVAFVCAWKFSPSENRYNFYKCDEKQYFQNVTPFESLTAPLTPSDFQSGDFIFSPVQLSPYTEVGIPETCQLCSVPRPTTWIGACCDGSNCNTVVGVDNCNGDFNLSKQCSLNCASLSCCDASGDYYRNCFSKSNWSVDPIQREQSTNCHDKFDIIGVEPLQSNMLTYALSQSIPTSLVTQFPDVDGKDCESCDGPCSRDRGTCCLRGKPIYNITSSECQYYGGLFRGCEGKPYSIPSGGGFNYTPNTVCQPNEGFLPSADPQTPKIQRGVAIASQSNLLQFRRGPFNSLDQIENAINNVPANNNNDRPMGLLSSGDDKLNFPNKPMVQLFWSSPEDSNFYQRLNQNGAIDDLNNVCVSSNLPNCNYDKTVLGTCCVQIACADGQYSALDDDLVDCYACVEDVSDCECAVLNGERSCGEHRWIANTENSVENKCVKCPCTQPDLFKYQVNDNCVDASTPINTNDPLDESEA